MKEIQEMKMEELKHGYVVSRFIKNDLSAKYSSLTYGYNPKYFSTLENYLLVCDEDEREEIKDTIELYEFHQSRYEELEVILTRKGYGKGGLDSLYEYVSYQNKWLQKLLKGEIKITDIA